MLEVVKNFSHNPTQTMREGPSDACSDKGTRVSSTSDTELRRRRYQPALERYLVVTGLFISHHPYNLYQPKRIGYFGAYMLLESDVT